MPTTNNLPWSRITSPLPPHKHANPPPLPPRILTLFEDVTLAPLPYGLLTLPSCYHSSYISYISYISYWLLTTSQLLAESGRGRGEDDEKNRRSPRLFRADELRLEALRSSPDARAEPLLDSAIELADDRELRQKRAEKDEARLRAARRCGGAAPAPSSAATRIRASSAATAPPPTVLPTASPSRISPISPSRLGGSVA